MTWSGYIQTDEHGCIRKFTTAYQDQPGCVKITDPELIEQLTLHQNQFLLEGGEIIRKPVVQLVPDKIRIQADGIDLATVQMVGVPEQYETVRVAVAGEEHTVARGEAIELTSEIAAPVMVALQEPRLWCKPCYVYAMVPQ